MKPVVKKASKPKVEKAKVVKSTLVGDNKVKGRKARSVASTPAENTRLRKNPDRPTRWPGGRLAKQGGGEDWPQSDHYDFNKDIGPKAWGQHRQRVATNARYVAKKAKLPPNGK